MGREQVGLDSYNEDRGKKFCRGCLSNRLFSALDLGELPIANELLSNPKIPVEKFSLHLRICEECGLGQVADVVTPERLFRDYRYLSSMSSTFLEHAREYAMKRIQEGLFEPGDWVLEIACNDGYLLKNFVEFKIKVLGIEPAENVAVISENLGIETVSEFFSSELAKKILKDKGFPKLIVANNVLAHVPNPMDFIKGLSILCGSNTLISIENPSLSNILIGMQFDTVYHEHYSYLTASSVSNLSKKVELQLFKVEQINIHGGSNRYWLRKNLPERVVENSAIELINLEKSQGLFEVAAWIDFSANINRLIENLRAWLIESDGKNQRIFGYGAAAKASTLINAVGESAKNIIAIADLSEEKQDRYMPSRGIPIISPDELFTSNPTDIIIFPWNIKSEITSYLRKNLKTLVNIWCAIPELEKL